MRDRICRRNSTSSMTVVGRASNSKGVYIETFDATGAKADLGFHLLVSC